MDKSKNEKCREGLLMKSIRWISLFLPLFLISACLWTFQAMAADEGLLITPRESDTGSIDEGKTITIEAMVENRSDKTVQITNIRTN